METDELTIYDKLTAALPDNPSSLWTKNPTTGQWSIAPEGQHWLEMVREAYPPLDIGPLWQKDSFGRWLLPEKTLGWEVLEWCADWLLGPNGGPWTFTDEQARLILWIFALNDDGTFKYRQVVYQALKGAGKDPFAAVLSIIHLIGPCYFSHWDESGEPVGRDDPAAWVQIAAVSKDQTKNTMKLFASLLPKRTREHFQLEVQKEIIYAFHGQRTLEAIASGHRSAEGNRVTWATLNETQHWVPSQGGIDLYDTITDNILKTGGRYICITNAPQPGEDSVAERIRNEQEKVWAGTSADSGWLYCSREAHPKAPLDIRIAPFILELIRGDAKWLPIPNIVLKMQDGSRAPSRIRRMFYNQLVATEDAFFSPSEWDGILAEGCYGDERDLQRGDEIVLGFDGGKTDDATALVAIRIRDRLIVPLLIEEKPEGARGEHWVIDRQLVDEAVRRAFTDFTVRAFFADMALWESYIDRWSEDYREVLTIRASDKSAVGWDMRGSREMIARGWEAFLQTVMDGHLKHNGNKILRVHALNAKRGHNGKGLIARKDNPESPRKIDAMVAAYVAFMALTKHLEKGKKPATQYRRRMVQA